MVWPSLGTRVAEGNLGKVLYTNQGCRALTFALATSYIGFLVKHFVATIMISVTVSTGKLFCILSSFQFCLCA